MFQKIAFQAIIIVWIINCPALNAQDLNKEVYVVRPYEPTLSDASKYNFLPSVDNLETSTPTFKYSISPKPLENMLDPEPIKAAKTVTTSLPKIYNSWLKLGFGNYNTPLAEFNISNLRSKEYAYGAYMRHKSSYSNLRLDNDDKIGAGYIENNIALYGKRFYSGATLSGNFRFDQNAFSFYGYNTSLFEEPPEIDKDSIRQRVYNPGVDIGIRSHATDSDQLNFDITGSFDYFIDRQKNKESEVNFNTSLSKSFYGLTGGLDLSLNYSQLHSQLDSVNNTIFRFNPWISKSSADWQFKLGFEAVADMADITRYYFYPRANLDIIIIKDVLVPFLGISGELQKNTYRYLFSENMFIKPGLSLKNTSTNFVAYGGLKGNISSVIRFRLDVAYTAYKNFHFFINDTVTADPLLNLQNQFIGVYDDINLITYHGQVIIAPTEKIEFMLDGKYFDYETFEEKKPWHKPDYEIGADVKYKPGNKLTFRAGLNFIGNRWVNIYPELEAKKIKPVFDANLSMNYHYSKLLTVFVDFYNLTERSYLLWNQYPSQRFNFMFGFSYKL